LLDQPAQPAQLV
jgi:hypothetical protein